MQVLRGANMFLVLSSYMYKYRQFKPDMIIVHEGINDCYAYMGEIYSPDYTHLRTNITELKEPSYFVKKLLRSNLLSLFIIGFNYQGAFMINKIVDDKKYPQWYICKKNNCDYYLKEHNAFYQNSVMLNSIAKNDSCNILYFPMIVNPVEFVNPSNAAFKNGILKHSEFWKELSNNRDVKFADISATAIDSKYFLDGTHLNGAGNEIKANLLVDKCILSDLFKDTWKCNLNCIK